MPDERRGPISDGIRTGISILTAFKEAVEETLEEALERGDLSRDRAKRAVRDAADRIQSTVEEAGERFDLVSRRDFEALRREVAELRARVDRLTPPSPAGNPPATRTTGLDDSVPVD